MSSRPSKRRAGRIGPVYHHKTAASVTLEYPFTLEGVRLDMVELSPPTLGNLTALRSLPVVSAVDVILAISGLPVVTIEAMRWPDIERILDEARALLPPDFVAKLFTELRPETAAPVEVSASFSPAAEPSGVNDLSDFMIDGSEFA